MFSKYYVLSKKSYQKRALVGLRSVFGHVSMKSLTFLSNALFICMLWDSVAYFILHWN